MEAIPIQSYAFGRNLRLASWLSLLFAMLAFAIDLAGSSDSETRLQIQADALFPLAVVKDVVLDGGRLRSWLCPPAPFAFPDWPLVGLPYLIFGDAMAAQIAFGLELIVIVLCGGFLCNRAVGIDPHRIRDSILILSLSVLLLLKVFSDSLLLQYFFMPAHHGGTVAMSILIVGAILYSARFGQRFVMRAWVSGLIVLAIFLLGASDLLTIAYLSAPLGAALIVVAVLKRNRLRSLIVPLAILFIIPYLGHVAGESILQREDPSELSEVSLKNIRTGGSFVALHAFRKLTQAEPAHWLAALLVGCGLFSFVMQWLVRSTSDKAAHGGRFVVWHYCWLSVCSTLCALVLGCSVSLWRWPQYDFAMHYWQPFVLMPIFAVAYAMNNQSLSAPPRWCRLGLQVLPFLVVFSSGYVIVDRAATARNQLSGYRPAFVKALDDAIVRHDLQLGLANYWQSKEINCTSQAGAKTIAVDDQLRVFHHMNTDFWKRDDSIFTQIDYFVANQEKDPKFDVATIVYRLGEPTLRINLDPTVRDNPPTLLVYKKGTPGRDAIAAMLTGFEPRLARVQTPHAFSMNYFNRQTGEQQDGKRFASEGLHSPGYLAFGPYVPLQAGEYRVSAKLEPSAVAAESVGNWDIGFQKPDESVFNILGAGTIESHQDRIEQSITIAPDAGGIPMEFRVFYNGTGRLCLLGVEFERIR